VGVDPPCCEDVGATQVVGLFRVPRTLYPHFADVGFTSSAICTRYGAWVHEKPLWFTADLIARIPNDFIPKRHLDVLNEAAGGQRRSTATMDTLELLAVPTVPAPALTGHG
jgi:hypothetical protein